MSQYPELPEPFGYLRDGVLDGLLFQREPPTQTQLVFCSTTPVFTPAQMWAFADAVRAQTTEERAAAIRALANKGEQS